MTQFGKWFNPQLCPHCRLPTTPVPGDLINDRDQTVDGRLHFGAMAWALFRLLRRRPGMIFENSVITEHLYGGRAEVNPQGVNYAVHKLRKKLEGTPYEIKRIYGVGYALVRRDAQNGQ